MSSRHKTWLILAIVVHYIIGLILFYKVSFWADAIWLCMGLPFGFFLGKMFRRREKLRLIEEWHDSHPTLSDYWLPKDLKDQRQA